MFCTECGESVPDDSKFCKGCGALVSPAVAESEGPAEESKEKKGFFHSPAGIIIASAVALAVLAGIGLGIFFMLRALAGNEVDAATVKVWDEYESMLDENSANAPQVTVDRSALAKSQEDLKKEQEQVTALEAVLAKTAGSKARRSGSGKSTSKQDVKADQMAAVLKAHKEYVEKLQELFTALDGANLLDPNVVANINKIIADLGKLGDKVKTLAKDFLKDNGKVASVRFDPSFLDFSSEAAADLQKNVTDAQQAEQQRVAAEQAAAAAAAEQQRRAAAQKDTTTNKSSSNNPEPPKDPNEDGYWSD